MITDAMLEADPYLHISDAINDPAEYVNLTDAILHDIARTKEPVRTKEQRRDGKTAEEGRTNDVLGQSSSVLA